MPAPRRIVTPEEIAARTAACRIAVELGAIEMRRKLDYPDTTRFEPICFGAQGCVHPVTLQPTTVEEWVADCRKRGIIPTVPNL